MTLFRYDDTRGTPLSNAPYSAYQRLEAGGAVLIMDTGGAPPLDMSLEAHAGCLSFEFSSPKQSLIVVNCGMPQTGRDDWRRFSRSTAAHSTVTFNETSSARFIESAAFRRVLGGAPMLGGPGNVAVNRATTATTPSCCARRTTATPSATASCTSAPSCWPTDGTRLEGEDMFSPPTADEIRGSQDAYAVRFHLHPSVKATRLTDGHGVMLMSANKDVWTFSAPDHRVDLEDSVYLAGSNGPRRTSPSCHPRQCRRHAAGAVDLPAEHCHSLAAATRQRVRADEPRLPLWFSPLAGETPSEAMAKGAVFETIHKRAVCEPPPTLRIGRDMER